MSELSLQGKVVLVTGSARRVGRAILMEFARNNANVVIHHHASDEAAQETASEVKSAYDVDAMICKADQSNPDDVQTMFDKIADYFGRLDVLVNSASIFTKTPILDVTYEEWQQVMGVNLTGPWLCLQAAGRMMRDQGSGVIINISDNSGLHPWSTRPAHSISKAALIMLTKTAAAALGKENIRVNCVVPGPVMKPPDDSDTAWQSAIKAVPMSREGTPEDVARACTFLATNDYINGAVLTVDGGESSGSRR